MILVQLNFMIALLLSVFSSTAFSHGDEVHRENHKNNIMRTDKEIKTKLAQINKSYLEKVKPIFAKKCLSCHGMEDSKP